MELINLIFNVLLVLLLFVFYIRNNIKHRIYMKKLGMIEERQIKDFRQLQYIIYISNFLETKSILPEIRTEWSIYPDFTALIFKKIKTHQANSILELGSGSSTILVAYYLKKQGQGKLISLEHDIKHYNKTKELLKLHELINYVDLIYAPFKKTVLKGFEGDWYDISALTKELKIDLLIVDGPPGYLNKQARYPAIPQLVNFLSKNAIIILDDCNRQDEKEIISRWQDEYRVFEVEKMHTENGTVILQYDKL